MAVKYTSYRFVILTLFSFCNIISAAHWCLFVPIVNKIRHAYPGATTDNINFMAMSFMICISIDNPVCAYISEKFGLRNALLLGAGMALIGGFLKSFINESFTYVVVG